MSNRKGNENDYLLGSPKKKNFYSDVSINETEILPTAKDGIITKETVGLKKHITLIHVILFVVTSATGAGIFISPSGVTEHVETVGASLAVWVFVGILSLTLAMCYCELGTAFPVCGGDYAYINIILGPFPSFLCLWVTVILLAPLGGTLMARTATEYVMVEFGLHKHNGLSTALMVVSTVLINVTFATLNSVSIKWSARLMSLLTVVKLAALLIVITGGFTLIARGETQNLQHPFAGTPVSPSKFSSAILPAYVAYIGWDNISTMAEEMKNPKRDLPLGALIGLVTVIFINVFMNLSYFTVLTTDKFMHSQTVGIDFAHQVFSSYTWIIPIFVACSAVGAVIGIYLGYSRYTYAAGKNGQLPQIFSYIHITWCSPCPAIMLQCLISVVMCVMPFFNLKVLLQISGVLLLLKASMAVIALLYLKRYCSHLKRTVEVPIPVVLLSLCILLMVITMSIIEDPYVNGLGCLSFAFGIPFYAIGKMCANSNLVMKYNEKVTKILQKILMVVPVDS